MDAHIRITSSVLVLLALILFAAFLKRRGLFEEHHGDAFSGLITKVTMPAIIFVTLARTQFPSSDAELALIMACCVLICVGLGWLIATMLRLEPARKAPVILASGFGSAAVLGVAIIDEAFKGDQQMITEAIILAGLGSQPLFFILGTIITIYYGSHSSSSGAVSKATISYFRSPIFLALVGGMLMSLLVDPKQHPIIESMLDGVHVIGVANTFLVALNLATLLRFEGLRQAVLVCIPVGAVKLVVLPLLLWATTLSMVLPAWQTNVLIVEGAMPSVTLTAVLCSAFGCDARFAAKLVVLITLASAVTIPLLYAVLS